MAYEIVSGKDDKPFFDTEYYLEMFRLAYENERQNFFNCSEVKKHILKIEEDNYKLAQELAKIIVPDIVYESDLKWDAKPQWQGKGYFIGMVEGEYCRSKKNLEIYKESLSDPTVQGERRERIMLWCRRLLKSLYLLEQGLNLRKDKL